MNLHSPLPRVPATPATAPDLAAGDDIRAAGALAEERYTAARRKYTQLYVECKSLDQPDRDREAELATALADTVSLAATVRKVQDGEPDAVRRELEAGQVSADERARTTNRFSIAELHRAAAASPTSWGWKR